MPRTVCVLVPILALFLINCGGSKSNPSVAAQLPSPSPTATPIPSPSPTPAPASAFIYAIITEPNAPHGDTAPNQVRGWGLRAGELVPVGFPELNLIPGSGSEEFIFVSPRNKLLYVIDVDGLFTNRLTSYSIGADGLLSQTGASLQLGETSTQMVFDPSGSFMFVTSDDGLHEYRVDSETDQLMEMPGSPFPVGASQTARGIVIHPSGRWVYASNFDETWQFELDSATGALTPVSKSSLGREQVMNIDPLGKFLYVLDVFKNGLAIFDIDSNGGLQLASDTSFPYILRSLSFDPASGGAYMSADSDLHAAKLLLASVDPANGSLSFSPESPLIIPEDLGLDGHEILSAQVQKDRVALVTSLWAIYLLRLDADGKPGLPPLVHVDATDGIFFSISQTAMTH